MPDRIYSYFSYDGEAELPEAGVANFLGRPHYFWLRENAAEKRTGYFDIALIDADLLNLVQEKEAIWHAWDIAYHAGELELSSHPAQPGVNPRYVELSMLVEERACILRSTARIVTGRISTSIEYLNAMRPLVGRKWPVPGTYSPVLEVTWQEYL